MSLHFGHSIQDKLVATVFGMATSADFHRTQTKKPMLQLCGDINRANAVPWHRAMSTANDAGLQLHLFFGNPVTRGEAMPDANQYRENGYSDTDPLPTTAM